MNGKRFHFCIDVSGILEWPKKDFCEHILPLFTQASGRPITYDEARAFLYEELAKGHKVLPVGKCDNFDYKEGCRGHELTPEQAAKVAEYEPVEGG